MPGNGKLSDSTMPGNSKQSDSTLPGNSRLENKNKIASLRITS